MTKLAEKYINIDGIEFELHEFDNSKLYPPTVVRAVQERNRLFFKAKQEDSREAIRISDAARTKAHASPTEDEYFQEKLRQQKTRELEQLLKEQAEAEAARQHKERLNDDSADVVSIVTGNPVVLLEDYAIRIRQGYSLIHETLSVSPTLYSIQLSKSKNERTKPKAQ